MLVDQDWVPVWVDRHEAAWALGRIDGFACELDALLLEFGLNVAHVVEAFEFLSTCIPTRVKGHHIFLQHTFEESYQGFTIFEDEPFLFDVSCEFFEAEFLVEGVGYVDVFYV